MPSAATKQVAKNPAKKIEEPPIPIPEYAETVKQVLTLLLANRSLPEQDVLDNITVMLEKKARSLMKRKVSL